MIILEEFIFIEILLRNIMFKLTINPNLGGGEVNFTTPPPSILSPPPQNEPLKRPPRLGLITL